MGMIHLAWIGRGCQKWTHSRTRNLEIVPMKSGIKNGYVNVASNFDSRRSICIANGVEG